MISFPSLSEDTLIVGTSGMLGRELVSACQRRERPVMARSGTASLDITCIDAVRRVLHQHRPGIVINAAGYTLVDGSECDFEQALLTNGDGPGNLARVCHEINALLVHYSSDYIFNGGASTPYHTDDPPDPVNSYGLSKLAGDKAIISSGCRFLILRTSWLFAPHGNNFVRTILTLAHNRDRIEVVNDQRGRPTYCADVADMTLDLLEVLHINANEHVNGAPHTTLPTRSRTHTGRIVHVANSGNATWYDFARQIVTLASLPCQVHPCTSESRLLHAPRPAYSVLDLSETIELIGRPRHWREALRECMESMGALAAHADRVNLPIIPEESA